MSNRIYTAMRRFNDQVDARFDEVEKSIWDAIVLALEAFQP